MKVDMWKKRIETLKSLPDTAEAQYAMLLFYADDGAVDRLLADVLAHEEGDDD